MSNTFNLCKKQIINDMNDNENIIKWCKLFSYILDKYTEAKNNLLFLIDIKNKVNKNTDKQDKDDVKFYNSILTDSIYFFNNSIKIRKLKFKNDLNKLNKFFGNKRTNILLLDITNLKFLLEEYYSNLIIESKKELKWIKDEYIVSLNDWEKDMTEILSYHKFIIDNFSKTLQNELDFYNSEGKIPEEIFTESVKMESFEIDNSAVPSDVKNKMTDD